MEVKLEGLIEKIKKEGISVARETSQGIEREAKDKAQKIITEAQVKAENIIKEAQKESTKLKSNAIAAVKQASRDVSLIVKEQLIKMFDNILKQQISKNLTPEFLKDLIVKAVNSWAPAKDVSFEVFVSEADKRKTEELVLSQFRKKAKDFIEIKVNPNIDKGFRIGIKGEDVAYDFTDQSILDAFKVFLTPSIAAVLDINNE
ncbi:MAG: hypothetical protein JSV34_01250 [Candidatus Omnitrophota bacterium]|nr:MAG: hypothetical protein JSV34_01250 [Candidatus Omnitrophota bacterium]